MRRPIVICVLCLVAIALIGVVAVATSKKEGVTVEIRGTVAEIRYDFSRGDFWRADSETTLIVLENGKHFVFQHFVSNIAVGDKVVIYRPPRYLYFKIRLLQEDEDEG